MNLLVEIKKEYLMRIKDNMNRNFYEGMSSIYNKAVEVSGNDDVLKLFQSFLKRVPKWTDEILANEVLRIRQVLEIDNKYELTNDLIKACLKASYNIMTFGINDNISFDIKQFLSDFSFKEFIRNVYVESSRSVYNNPFLFYHNYSPIEIKRNQREVLDLISESIENTIRNMLPINIILSSYLNSKNKMFKISYPNNVNNIDQENNDLISNLVKDDLENDIYKNLVDKSLNQSNDIANQNPDNVLDEQNFNNAIDIVIDGPVNMPLDTNNQNMNRINEVESNPSAIQGSNNPVVVNTNSIAKQSNKDESIPEVIDKVNSPVVQVNQSQVGGEYSNSSKKSSDSSQSNKSVNNKILEIINEKSLDLSKETKSISDFESNSKDKKDTQTGGSNVNETFIANNSELSISKDNKSNNGSNKKSNSADYKKSQSELDSKLEKLLKNDLGDTETESTMAVDNQSNYQEVFSNSNRTDSSLNSQQKQDEISKNKFFSNYLQL
tara:strand:+ start:243 stop:1727 length:1485 start_codon:yes stop_codon:yes gene_type:complete